MAINVKDKLVTLESLGVAYSAEQDAREEADQALSTRIDNIVAPDGDPSLTEVSDARVSGSTTYNTLKARLDADKTAIGTEISQLSADLGAYGATDVLPTFADYKQTLSKGVTYTWSNGVCTMSGTATDTSIDNLYYDNSALPSGIIPGKTYRVKFASTAGTAIYCNILLYKNGGNQSSINFYGDGDVYIPEESIGMAIRIRMSSGVVATGHTVSLSLIQAPANSDLADLVSEDRYANTREVAGFFSKNPKTSNGITFTWNGTAYVIDGTSTTGVTYDLISSRAKIPSYIIPGGIYRLSMRLPYPAKVEILTYVNNDNTTTRYEADTDIILPADIEGIVIRLYIAGGQTFAQQTGNVSFARISNRRLMTDSIVYADGTNKGVTFTWQDGTCTLNGNMGDNQFAFNTLYNDETALPPDILPGHSYYCEFDSTDDNVGLETLVRLTDGRYTQTPLWVSGMVFDVPTDAVGMIFRLRCVGYKTFSGGTIGNIRIYEYRRPYKMPKLLVSFVDDDASADNYVTQYHDACMRNGIRGNYAVMPKRLDDEVTSAQNLLDYELEGFGMLVHAYEQNQACWRAATYDYDLAYADLLLGCRKMQAYGFTDFRYWVYPEGHRWKQIERIGRKAGMRCALGTDSYDYNHKENAERYFLKRCTFNPNDNNVNKSLVALKAIVDKAAADGRDVWLIITTHFNEWENYMTYDTTVDSTGYAVGYPRFNELVQYVLGKGFEVINVPGGFTYYEPYLVN